MVLLTSATYLNQSGITIKNQLSEPHSLPDLLSEDVRCCHTTGRFLWGIVASVETKAALFCNRSGLGSSFLMPLINLTSYWKVTLMQNWVARRNQAICLLAPLELWSYSIILDLDWVGYSLTLQAFSYGTHYEHYSLRTSSSLYCKPGVPLNCILWES